MDNKEIAKEGFRQLVLAVQAEIIDFERCALFEDLFVHTDSPNGVQRFTYAIFNPNNKKQVIAQCAIVYVGRVQGGNDKWQISWFTHEGYRGKGIGYETVSKTLQEFEHHMKGKILDAYIEANVDEGNEASIKIARKLIGGEELLDKSDEGIKVYSFLKQF